MLRVTVNGVPRQFADGQTILHALQSIGIEIPTICHDSRLKPFAGCRLCVVQLQGRARPLPACASLLADGMVIETHTPRLEEERRTLLKLMANSYPSEALHRFPEKEFHKQIQKYGLTNDCRGQIPAQPPDASNPYIQVDMSKCILCYRCVRICEEVQGQFVWQIWNRGDATRILSDSGTILGESSCVTCGACVDTCPTGALEDKSVLAGMPTSWTTTTCPYCGTGCELRVGTRDGRIAAIKPVLDAPVNRGHLCVKGRYAYEFVYAGDRVTQPMIRKNGNWQRVSWKEAITFAACALKRIVDLHGPDSVAPVPRVRLRAAALGA